VKLKPSVRTLKVEGHAPPLRVANFRGSIRNKLSKANNPFRDKSDIRMVGGRRVSL
jgi:hypothetical protein